MGIPTTIDEALPIIAQALHSLQGQSRPLDDPRSEVIRKVWEAVDKTKMFLASVRRGDASDKEPNPELVRLWSDASLAIAVLDEDFASRLREKAEYWSDPEFWTHEQVQRARIAIDEIAAEARSLLMSPRKPVASTQESSNDSVNIFISHASEDKQAIAAPLARALSGLGYSVWYDEYTLKLGDSLRREIDKGLASCRYGVVVLSHSFFSKEWPQRELDALFALEVSERKKRILPIWHNINIDEITRYSPTLADRLGVSTVRGLEYVVQQIVDVLIS